jgi:hypothetical protein
MPARGRRRHARTAACRAFRRPRLPGPRRCRPQGSSILRRRRARGSRPRVRSAVGRPSRLRRASRVRPQPPPASSSPPPR